jgi:glycosyltransferase involved in cell wall biosynthesis
MKKVLVFFPHNLWPPRTGAHQRGLEIMSGLRELGCAVALASSTLTTDTPWQDSSIAELREAGIARVHLYEPTPSDERYVRLWQSYYRPNYLWLPVVRRLYPLGMREAPFNTRMRTPPGMRAWFDGVIRETAPDMIVMSYAYWDRLVNHSKLKSITRVVDTIDMVTLNQRMQKAVRDLLPVPLRVGGVPERVLREDFFDGQFSPAPEELQTYDRYDYSIAIAAKEAEIIRQGTRRTKVVLLPMTVEPRYIANRYTDAALFPVGPNFFNTQGYLYFVNRVLPRVRKLAPSFSLRVTGDRNVIPQEPVEGVTFSGFVPELSTVYEGARFVVCPVFGGTGQQVKIVEAMAHGLPVVALRAAAERSPMRHGVNGLVAENAEEFAGHVVRLWNDPALCRRLGDAARETVALEFSRERLTECLSTMLGG